MAKKRKPTAKRGDEEQNPQEPMLPDRRAMERAKPPKPRRSSRPQLKLARLRLPQEPGDVWQADAGLMPGWVTGERR